jgi:hypothetical protein
MLQALSADLQLPARCFAHLIAVEMLGRMEDIQTTNLGVGGSNPSGRASDFNDLHEKRRSKQKIKTVFRTVKFSAQGPFGPSPAPRAFRGSSTLQALKKCLARMHART